MADILISFFLMLFGAGALVIIAFCIVYVYFLRGFKNLVGIF